MQANASNEGEVYPDWTPFTPVEFRKHIGVYMINGVSPSPSVGMKMKSQNDDDINGNDFVRRCIGPGGKGATSTSDVFLQCRTR